MCKCVLWNANILLCLFVFRPTQLHGVLAAVLLRVFVCVCVFLLLRVTLIFPLAWGLVVCLSERVVCSRLEGFSFYCFCSLFSP